MKHTLILLFAAALLGHASAQTAPARPVPTSTPAPATAAASEEKAMQIVFVPKKLLDEQLASGKLKDNTFYWTNTTDNVDASPKPMAEEGKPFLRITPIKNINGKPAIRGSGRIEIIRAYNVPENANHAKININGRLGILDVWEDDHRQGSRLDGNTYLTRNGKKLGAGLMVPSATGTWNLQETNIKLPPKTQQIVISVTIDGILPFDLSSLEVTFTTP